MPTVINVQFRPVTKLYHFSPGPLLDLTVDDYVIVETSRGQEVAQVVAPPHMIDESEVVGEIKPVARRATAWDLVQKDRWERKEQEALAVCRDKARASSLDIKIVRCEYSFDGGRLLVYFSSEQRVDFRDLVRDLARIFHTHRDAPNWRARRGQTARWRRQVRAAKQCCTSWLREFTPVSIRMAKNQQLPLNPDEISGVCGRLLCCLSYENAHYREQNKRCRRWAREVITPQGVGRVRHIHPLKETVTVLLQSSVLSEFAVADLITSKSAAGAGCSTCGGCTVKRRQRRTRQCAGATGGVRRTRRRRLGKRRHRLRQEATQPPAAQTA